MPERQKRPRPRFIGKRPLKTFVVRIVPKVGEGAEEKRTFHAPSGRHWTEENVEETFEKVVDYLDRKYPAWEFRMVNVGNGQVNFVYDGDRSNEGIAAALQKREGKVDGERLDSEKSNPE